MICWKFEIRLSHFNHGGNFVYIDDYQCKKASKKPPKKSLDETMNYYMSRLTNEHCLNSLLPIMDAAPINFLKFGRLLHWISLKKIPVYFFFFLVWKKQFFGLYILALISIWLSSFHNFHFNPYIFKLAIILVAVIISLTKNIYIANGLHY